jgi:hypothetical protein
VPGTPPERHPNKDFRELLPLEVATLDNKIEYIE